MQAEKLAVQRGRAEDDGSDRQPSEGVSAMKAAAGRGGRMRLEACLPRWDAASSTECTLPVLGAVRMQAEKLAVQRGRAEDDGGDR